MATVLVVVLVVMIKHPTEGTWERKVGFGSQFKGTLHSSEEVTGTM